MATIVYLDVEDEITSAATRIRTADDRRVALVLPFGSRVATSRINFRLLAREATLSGRRLDIVAPDASARSLAAAAGLPVFASVGEYEEALDVPADSKGATPAVDDAAATPPPVVPVPLPRADREPRRDVPARDRGASRPRPAPPPQARDERDERDVPANDRSRRRIRPGLVILLAALLLTLLAGGVAGYVLLPAAEITVTPRIEPIQPISFVVRADPTVTEVDPATDVIPADTLEVPAQVSGEFPATGVRTVETRATGAVRFSNCDPTASYSIPKGTVVRTAKGTGFTTDEQVFLPVATISGNPPDVSVHCQSSEVAVTAVEKGTSGNVAAGAISVVPARYNRQFITVTNPAATHGGSHKAFPKVTQKDVDRATEQLRKDLEEQFATAAQEPPEVPAGATVFPDTATMGEPTLDGDPASLVNTEVKSFTLGMSVTGQVLAVDSSPVEAIAESRLEGSISDGYALVPGSIDVAVGDGEVVGGQVSFPVTGTARQVRQLDAGRLKAAVLGLPLPDARSMLGQYGEVSIALWPDWVSAVPTLDQRVNLSIGNPLPPGDDALPTVPASSPSALPAASGAKPSAGASGSFTNDGASEPVPSG